MRHAQYFHDVDHARISMLIDDKRGYDTLHVELNRADGTIATFAIFFTGKADIEGAHIFTPADPTTSPR